MRSHPRVVAEHKDLVLQCLTDEDITIRLRALELLTGMVTRRNLPDIVQVCALEALPYRGTGHVTFGGVRVAPVRARLER